MGQFSVKTSTPPGSLLGETQQAEGEITAVEAVQATQGASITTLQTTAATLAGEMADIQTDLVTTNANVALNASAITGLDASIALLSSEVATQGASVTLMQSAIDTVEGSVALLSSEVAAQSASVTQMQTALSTATTDIALLQTQVSSGGGNFVTNSEMSGSGGHGYGTVASAIGWSYYANHPNVVASVNGAGVPWMIGGQENNLAVYQTGADQAHLGLWYQDVPVKVGVWYEFSCIAAAHRCGVNIYLEWKNNAGGTIEIVPGHTIATPGGGGPLLGSWSPLFMKASPPDGTTNARIIMQKLPSNVGEADSWAWFSRPQLAETSVNGPSPKPYSSGNNRAVVSVQQASINGLFARWGFEIDVNGYVSGMVMNNNGQRADLNFLADRVRFIAPGGGARTEYANGAWKVFDANGVKRVQMGNLLA